MAYPKDLLAPGETVVYEFGSHWFALVKEALVTIAYVVLLILLVPDGVNGWAFTIITLFGCGSRSAGSWNGEPERT